jgi:hypothetical protein
MTVVSDIFFYLLNRKYNPPSTRIELFNKNCCENRRVYRKSYYNSHLKHPVFLHFKLGILKSTSTDKSNLPSSKIVMFNKNCGENLHVCRQSYPNSSLILVHKFKRGV